MKAALLVLILLINSCVYSQKSIPWLKVVSVEARAKENGKWSTWTGEYITNKNKFVKIDFTTKSVIWKDDAEKKSELTKYEILDYKFNDSNDDLLNISIVDIALKKNDTNVIKYKLSFIGLADKGVYILVTNINEDSPLQFRYILYEKND